MRGPAPATLRLALLPRLCDPEARGGEGGDGRVQLLLLHQRVVGEKGGVVEDRKVGARQYMGLRRHHTHLQECRRGWNSAIASATRVSIHLPTCLSAYLPACLPTHPPAYLPTYLPTYLEYLPPHGQKQRQMHR